MAMSTVAIHVFGDVPSSPLVGILEVRFLEIPGHTFYSFYIESYLSRNECLGNSFDKDLAQNDNAGQH
jgi:hypothetical protein